MLCPGSGSGIARTMSWTGSQNTAPLPLPGVLSVALSVPAQASGQPGPPDAGRNPEP